MTLMTSAAEIFREVDESEAGFEQLFKQLEEIGDMSAAVERFGINPTAVAMLSARGHLLNTCLDGVALEHVQFDGPEGAETQLALEALDHNAQDKAAAWSAKILGFIKNVGGKILGVLSAMMDKISGLIKAGASKVWDKTKEVGHYVKAHPVKTIVALIAAISAVTGIMIYSASNLPGAMKTREAMDAFSSRFKQMTARIPWPFGKPDVSTSGGLNGFKVGVKYTSLKQIPFDKMSWNQKAAAAIGRQFDSVSHSLKSGFSTFGTKAYESLRRLGHGTFGTIKKIPQVAYDLTGSSAAAAGASLGAGWVAWRFGQSVVYAIYRLIKTIVIGAFRLIHQTLAAVFH